MEGPDRALHNKVERLHELTVQLDRSVAVVNGQVAAVSTAQQQTRSELAQLSSDFNTFVLRAERTANVQRAETRVGVLESRIEYDFGRYDTVRRTAAGLLWSFDSGLVTQQTVESATEKLMLENSRYWLAPAVVGLGAWSGGDSVLCDQAIATAYQLAPARTALLFALILRRQNRQPSSVLWLRHYLRNLDPTALSREFAVVLESVAQGAFGTSGRELIHETVDHWLRTLADDEEAHNAQVKRWRFEIERHVPAGAIDAFPRLQAHSPQWPQLETALRSAGVHQPFLDHYSALLAAEYTPSDRIEDAVDDILDQLVTEYDDEELPLRRELAAEQAIIKHEGDLAAAKQTADAGSAALGNTLDYLTIQTSAALDPAAIGVSAATQQVALASCIDWAQRAHGAFSMGYRSAYPANVEVCFQEQHPFGKNVFTLPPWTGSLTATAMPQLEKSLAAHWDASTGPLLASLQFNMGRELIKPALVAALILIVGIAINPAFGVIAGAAVFGLWYLAINGRRAKAEAYRKQVETALAGHKRKSLEDLRGAGAEYTDLRGAYQSADAKEPQVQALIASFGDLGHDKTPFERRTLSDERNYA